MTNEKKHPKSSEELRGMSHHLVSHGMTVSSTCLLSDFFSHHPQEYKQVQQAIARYDPQCKVVLYQDLAEVLDDMTLANPESAEAKEILACLVAVLYEKKS